MMKEIMDEGECKDLGIFFTNEILYDKDLKTFIPEKVKSENPERVIAFDNNAPVEIKMKKQKKMEKR